MPMTAVILMAILVVALAAYAGYLLTLVARKRAGERKQQRMAEQAVLAKRADNQNSIDIIARCLLQEQVTLTEAAIRISTLARSLSPALVEQQFYLPFDALAKATSHIPILDSWQQLPREQKKQFSIERESIEQAHKQRVLDAAQQLITMQ